MWRACVRLSLTVESVVKAAVGEVDEVGGGDGHLVQEDLALDLPHGRIEGGNRVGHGGGGVCAVAVRKCGCASVAVGEQSSD